MTGLIGGTDENVVTCRVKAISSKEAKGAGADFSTRKWVEKETW